MAKPLPERNDRAAQLFAKGITYSQIGERLGISRLAARAAVRQVRRKKKLSIPCP
jgi:DNA-binding CsgD family transcriptional regulator